MTYWIAIHKLFKLIKAKNFMYCYSSPRQVKCCHIYYKFWCHIEMGIAEFFSIKSENMKIEVSSIEKNKTPACHFAFWND